jgi:hypothetical protein
MDYSMIGKIQKAKDYAQDPSRVTFDSFTIEFQGNNNHYAVTLGPDGWHCTCPGFQTYGICPHIMSLERRFGAMLKREPIPYAPGQNVVSDVEKAMQYAQEPERMKFLSFSARFRGNHNDYTVTYDSGKWDCDNDYFRSRGICSHTMAMEILLKGMVKPLAMPTPL